MNHTQSKPIVILLDNDAHRYAKQFASEQANPTKGKQVYLNTLAVCGVHTYLKLLDINSNISHSDCWQSGLRATFNLADLTLPKGKIECLWLLPGEETVNIPLEVRDNRLGYVVVQLEAELKQIELLGFIPSQAIQFDTESLNIDQLQPLEKLFDVISAEQQTHLKRWLDNIFTADWQPVETILAGRMTRSLATVNPAITTVTRGKVIQWQLNSLEREIILVLKTIQQSDKAIDLCLQIYPGQINNNLPDGLSVSILDRANQTCLSAQAKDTDDWMQLEFSCQSGEEFKIEMNLAGVSVVEQFIV